MDPGALSPRRRLAAVPDALPTDVDVIVVGAGSAGCVVTRRLVDAGRTVMLVEAGAADDGNEVIADPPRMHDLWDTGVDWRFRTTPQAGAHGRRLHLPRGKVVGGSSALNAMAWVRGHRADYDTWAYLGNAQWSWADVEPVFRAIERTAMNPSSGPLDICTGFTPDPIQQSILDAAVEAGLPLDANYNDGTPEGASLTQLTLRGGQRLTTARAYLADIENSPLLHVCAGNPVARLTFAGTRCTGIELCDRVHGTGTRLVRADRVVVCAGAIGSPVLLQRSGIGDPALLKHADIDVVAPLHGVGRNLQDHWLVPLIFSTERAIVRTEGLPACQSQVFWRSRPELPTPDLHPVHYSKPMLADWMFGPAEGFSLMAGLVRPASRGHVGIRDADPNGVPIIDPRVLSAQEDVDALAAAVQLCRDVGAQPALREAWGASEAYPGTLAVDAQSLRDYVRESVVTCHHQAGTCAMGAGEDAVVDSRLAVHGVEGLTVADASIMPTITTGNTNAPTAMIGARAAAFLTSTT